MTGATEAKVVGPGFHALVFALVRRIPTGSARQRNLLEAEGVEFSESGKIPLARYAWVGTADTESTRVALKGAGPQRPTTSR